MIINNKYSNHLDDIQNAALVVNRMPPMLNIVALVSMPLARQIDPMAGVVTDHHSFGEFLPKSPS